MTFEGFDSPNDKDIVKRLKDYFDNTSDEKIQEGWRKSAKYDSVGITCKEFSDRFLQPKQKNFGNSLINLEIMTRETYTYKEKEYYIEAAGEMKCPHTREWKGCIIYIQLETGLRFVRESVEFFELFKPTK